MFQYKRISLAAIVGMALAGPAIAADYTVVQKNKSFDKTELTISVGDTVRFANEDIHAHNVYSRSSANRFDVGLQNPGTWVEVFFATQGTIRVRCAIHPKMKMTITVKP